MAADITKMYRMNEIFSDNGTNFIEAERGF
jgi:hypothetical protein